MVLPTEFADAATRARSLADLTSLRVGGRPEYLFEPSSEEDAAAVLGLCHRCGVPVRLLGGGTNVLAADDILDGAVLATWRLKRFEIGRDRVTAGAGYPFPALVRRAAWLGLPGLSGCPGIPGTVGGAVAMNAGGRFGCTADALVEVRGFHLDGTPFDRRVREGDLGYRQSVFEGRLVTTAVFRREDDLDPVAEARTFRRALEVKRSSQPLGALSAGCTFKNPAGVSAGRLLEEAGLKGLRVGGARISTRHANFVLNEGGASAADVRSLIAEARAAVRERFGIELELEVRVWS